MSNSPARIQDSERATQRTVIRFAGRTFAALCDHLRSDPKREQFAFLLARPIANGDEQLLLVQDLFLPEPGDLVKQTAGGIEPHSDFQALVYLVASQRGLVLIDAHTHVGTAPPALSRIDRDVAMANMRYIAHRFPPPVTMGLLVFNSILTAFEGLAFNRERAVFEPIDELQTLGPELRSFTGAPASTEPRPDERYARQYLVPGWNQQGLARLRIGIVGLGGHGSQLLQTLVSIGAGAAGWIAGVDPDLVEVSNIPRIPYATPEDIGQSKVKAAASFVQRKAPDATFHPFTCSVTDTGALAKLRMCDVLFACGDNDGVRLASNDLAVRCGIPLIDLGADILAGTDKVEAGGQVRVVLPGTTACLACCNAFDSGRAALDLLNDTDRSVFTRRGYVIGSAQVAAPSVAVLNALVVQYAVSALLALIGSGPFVRSDYMHVDWLTGRTLSARAPCRDDCPACGTGGFLMAGPIADSDSCGGQPTWTRLTRGDTGTEDVVFATRARRRRPRRVPSPAEH